MDLLVSSPDRFAPRTHQQVLTNLTNLSPEELACIGSALPGHCFGNALRLLQRWHDRFPLHYVEGWYLAIATNEATHRAHDGSLLLNATLTLSVHGWLEDASNAILDPTLISILLSSPEPPLRVLYLPAVRYSAGELRHLLKLEGATLPLALCLADCLAEATQSYLVAYQVARKVATAVMDLAAAVHQPLEAAEFPQLLARDLLRLPPLHLRGGGKQEGGASW
jgi:hypothetical protein